MKPLLLSTWSFGARANEVGWPVLEQHGSLAAVEAVCAAADLDPTVDSVGYGGLPDASGRMSLDGAVMLSPERFGGVCGMRHHQHPASVGRLVMEQTDHVLLCGEDADDFAAQNGMPQTELLSPSALEAWKKKGNAPAEGHDTISAIALDRHGTLATACSTSGLAWKLPGRVGDAPIAGHGLYCVPGVGAAVATGTGEWISGLFATFLAVEILRGGASPIDAVAEILDRADHSESIDPKHQLALIVLNAAGEHASGSFRRGYRTAVRDANGGQLAEVDIVQRPEEALPEHTGDQQ
jgi:L-asparaginase/N4-(beta-N-acetylglucosaminyl)-L-asparaginase